MMDSNPFGGAAAPQSNAATAVNPFDPFGGRQLDQQQQQPPPPQDPWSTAPREDAGSVVSGYSNPYGGGSTYGAAVPSSPPPYGNNPYAPAPAPAAQSNPYSYGSSETASTAVVVSTTQSNPYAMTAAPQSNPYGQTPWQQPAQYQGTSGGYSPYGAPAQQQYQQPQQQPTDAMQTYQPGHVEQYQQPIETDPSDPFGLGSTAPVPAKSNVEETAAETTNTALVATPPRETVEEAVTPQRSNPPERRKDSEGGEFQPPPDATASPAGTTYPPQFQFGQKKVDVDEDPEPVVTTENPRNRYAEELAQRAPQGASPLPKAELVRKRGFVLARISFRTIVMKKWKQTYWVQYGPHTMLWFRSQSDFDDWLNNPYHQQAERNFLIKLAVNFVHDLYKPNVRGYQVTQCRTKGYGNKMVRQFKLERWMDYGPTIAAAFGSYNPKEVDALREAIVECMRNTPLSGGIRATGAVRQPNPPQRREDEEIYHNGANRSTSFDELPKDDNDDEEEDNEPMADDSRRKDESIAEEADLLDVNNWDDVQTEPQQTPYGASPPSSPQAPTQPQQQYQQQYQQQNQYQQQQSQYQPQQQQPPQYGQSNPYGNPAQSYSPAPPAQSQAIVPVSGPPQSYPGAPPPPPQQQQWAQTPAGYAQPYLQNQQQPQQPSNPWGAPAANPYAYPQQQQY